MFAHSAVASALVLGLVGCSDPPKPASTTPPTGSASALSPHPSPPTNPKATDSATDPPGGAACAAIRKEASALVESPDAADLSCTDDVGCGCAPAIVDCGGVYRNTVADKLSELGKRRADNDCGYYTADGSSTFACGPWQCIPRCINGACRNAPK